MSDKSDSPLPDEPNEDVTLEETAGELEPTEVIEAPAPIQPPPVEKEPINESVLDIQEILSLLPTLTGTEQEKALARIKTEYENLTKIITTSKDNEVALVGKCRELANELSTNASKVQAALKLSQDDRATIASLRQEVKKAWKMVELASDKSVTKDAVDALKDEKEVKQETQELSRTRLLELKVTLEESLKKANQEKENMEIEIGNLKGEVRSTKASLDELNGNYQQLIAQRSEMDQEMALLKEILNSKKVEQDREVAAREKAEELLKTNTDAWERKEAEYKSKTADIRALKDQIIKLENQLTSDKTLLQKVEKEKEELATKSVRLQHEHDEQALTTEKLLDQNHEATRHLKVVEEEAFTLKENLKMMSRIKETLTKKLKSADESKLALETERDALKSENLHLIADKTSLLKELESFRKSLENVSYERDIAQKNFVKATGTTQKQFTVIKTSEQAQKTMEQEIQSYKDEASKMRKLILSLEKERDAKMADILKYEQESKEKENELKVRDLTIFDSKKKLVDLERRLKEQQTLYENARADRNVYSKNLNEALDEVNEMKRKLKIMNHQVEQLKEEILQKETVLVKEHNEHSKLEKEKETLALQVSKLQQHYDDVQHTVLNLQQEESKLRHVIIEADQERLKQKKEYDAVVQERDVLGTQLIRRNDELSLLYEKIKIQNSTLSKGEVQYKERLEDIRVLRLEIKRLRREMAILQTETQHVDSLKNEIFKLQRDVLKERTRVKVLEEELESPMNIHRWRKLQGSDPSTFELITKVQTLQKRLISKTEEVVEKELLIQQKEKLYKDIKEILARQPGPEVMDELRTVREAARSKTRESKALASELNMYHSQVNEYKYEIERLSRELQDMKKKYYFLRKKQLLDKPTDIVKATLPPTKFNGGGFNMSNAAPNESTAKAIISLTQDLPALPDSLLQK